jgi:C4-dicarboxylate-specific signal transduction histidine kinase
MSNRIEGASPELVERLMRIARVSALEEMASGFAHELNQPLGAIATFASAGERMLEKDGSMIPKVGAVLRQIRDEAMHAGDGIRRIRRLFEPVDERTSCALPDLIDELRPVIEASVARAGVTLVIAYQPQLPRTNVDRLRIQHVLLTFVQNALEATPPGRVGAQIRIDVTATRYEVEVAVADRGTGIAAEHRGQIFRPFFTTKPGGTGLGLASSRAMIEAHEGSIGFDDVEAGGARFYFRLPIAEGE